MAKEDKTDMIGQSDYYPLIADAVLEYRRTEHGGGAAMKMEVISVGRQDAASGSMTAVVAKCRRTWQWDGGAPEINDVEVGKLLDPVLGEVVFNGVDADRKP